METWTTDEICDAFWKCFHKSGERWFDYLGTDEENQESTKAYWEEFLDCLVKVRNEYKEV
jgi:hypothetical protein